MRFLSTVSTNASRALEQSDIDLERAMEIAAPLFAIRINPPPSQARLLEADQGKGLIPIRRGGLAFKLPFKIPDKGDSKRVIMVSASLQFREEEDFMRLEEWGQGERAL